MFVTILFLFYVLFFGPPGRWDLSSLARGGTCPPTPTNNLETGSALRAAPEVSTMWNEWSREAGIALKTTHSQARRLLEPIDAGDVGRNRAALGSEVGK